MYLYITQYQQKRIQSSLRNTVCEIINALENSSLQLGSQRRLEKGKIRANSISSKMPVQKQRSHSLSSQKSKPDLQEFEPRQPYKVIKSRPISARPRSASRKRFDPTEYVRERERKLDERRRSSRHFFLI